MEKNNRKVFYQGIHKLLWISYFCCLYWNIRGGKRKQDAVYCFRKMQENMCLLYEGAGEVQHFIACNFHVRNMLLHGQSNTAVGRSLTTWILLLKAFLQNVVAFCNKTSCLALMGSLLREYNCLCLLSFCSNVWIAVGHQGFQLWICWWCSTQYCTANHSFLWTLFIQCECSSICYYIQGGFVTKPRPGPAAWWMVHRLSCIYQLRGKRTKTVKTNHGLEDRENKGNASLFYQRSSL